MIRFIKMNKKSFQSDEIRVHVFTFLECIRLMVRFALETNLYIKFVITIIIIILCCAALTTAVTSEHVTVREQRSERVKENRGCVRSMFTLYRYDDTISYLRLVSVK